jgi:selT/selW/selH-like putative selenoprotein
LAEELINEFGDKLESITLVRGAGVRFEVTVDGATVFSKAQERRHPRPGEVLEEINTRKASGRDIGKMAH